MQVAVALHHKVLDNRKRKIDSNYIVGEVLIGSYTGTNDGLSYTQWSVTVSNKHHIIQYSCFLF